MNDVVERLRRYIREGDVAGENEKTLSDLLRDAADEIYRLRAVSGRAIESTPFREITRGYAEQSAAQNRGWAK